MTDADDARDADVGSLAEETAKLLGALSGWAREHGADAAQGFAGAAGHVGEVLHEVDEHIATGSAECTYCPICRTVHAVRMLSPEVKQHLAVAASSLAQAAAGMLATVAPQPGQAPDRPPGSEGVEHIDLDGDWPDDPADEPDSDKPAQQEDQ